MSQQQSTAAQPLSAVGPTFHEDGRRKDTEHLPHSSDDSNGIAVSVRQQQLSPPLAARMSASSSTPTAATAPLPPVHTAATFTPSSSLPTVGGSTSSLALSQPSTPRVSAPPATFPSSLASSSSSSSTSPPAVTATAAPATGVNGNGAHQTPVSAHGSWLGAALPSLPMSSHGSSGALPSSGVGALDSLLDGVSGSSDEDSQLRMIEEEDEDDMDELAASSHKRGLASGRGSRRRPLMSDDVAADEEFSRWGRHSPMQHPAHYTVPYPFMPHSLYPYHPGMAVSPHSYMQPAEPYYSHSLHSAHLAPQRYPHQPVAGGVSQPTAAPLNALSSPSAAPSTSVSSSVWSSAPSSSSSSLFSAPISLRGLRTFVFVSVVLNVGCLLVRDASLHSFALFLVLANTVAALCIVTGRPFSLAILLQAKQPATAPQTNQPAAAVKQQASSSNNASLRTESTSQPTQPSSLAPLTSAQSRLVGPPLHASETAAPRAVSQSPPKLSATAAPNSLPGAPPPSVSIADAGLSDADRRQPALITSLSPTLSMDQASVASVAAASSTPASLVGSAVHQHASISLPAIETGMPTAVESSASSSANSSPSASRSPSPALTFAAAASVLSPAPSASISSSSSSSSAPSYDSGPWTIPPLPLFVRGYIHKLVAGCSTHYSDKPELASWCRTAGESFQVRIGPNYKRTKAKSASAPSLYECVGVDILQTESKIDHIARCIKLPLPQDRLVRRDVSSQRMEQKRKAAAALLAASGASQSAGGGAADGSSAVDPQVAALMAELPDGDFEDEYEYVATADDAAIGVPPLWIVNFQIPAYPPPMPMWGKKEDGEGYSVVLYYSLTEQAKDDLRHNSTPAAKLLKTFIRDCGDEKMHGRYKSIPKIMNPDDCEVGRTVRSLIQSYNAKPFLTGPWCHQFVKGPGYVEVDIDVHRFRFVARKGAHSFLESLKSMVIDIAFVVEGQDDDELPEQIQAATRLHFPSPQDARNIQHFLKAHNNHNSKQH